MFLKKTIEENPNEIILACIGQLTNIGLLFAAYPHIPSLLKGMVVMGGRFHEDELFDMKKWGIVEWNIKCDPFAAKIVFDADVKNFYIAGIEHTCRFSKSVTEASEKIKHIPWMEPVADAVLRMTKTWFHDPVALWAMLYKDEVKWKRGNISVDLENTNMGMTSFTEDKNGKHIVLADIDVDQFFDSYAEQLGFKWD